MLLTVLGVGNMGALIAMQYASEIPIALKFSWTDIFHLHGLVLLKFIHLSTTLYFLVL